MPEYFVVTNSFAASFFSDQATRFVTAATPQQALEHVAAAYGHPAGLYAADCYANADAYHKRAAPLARWLSNHAQAVERLVAGQESYSLYVHGPGVFDLNGVTHTIDDPRGGGIVPVPADA